MVGFTAHGLDLETVRAGIDLNAVMAHVKEGFGWDAYYSVAQRARRRPIQALPHAPGGRTPLICWRVFVFVHEEAVARGEDVTPAHWLLVETRGLTLDQLRTAVLEELGQDR